MIKIANVKVHITNDNIDKVKCDHFAYILLTEFTNIYVAKRNAKVWKDSILNLQIFNLIFCYENTCQRNKKKAFDSSF